MVDMNAEISLRSSQKGKHERSSKGALRGQKGAEWEVTTYTMKGNLLIEVSLVKVTMPTMKTPTNIHAPKVKIRI